MAYTFGTIDELGDGVFRKVRQELGVTAFGVNVLVIPSGVEARPHFHEEQDELYFVHAGRAGFATSSRPRRARSRASATRISSCSSSARRTATSGATASPPILPSSVRSGLR